MQSAGETQEPGQEDAVTEWLGCVRYRDREGNPVWFGKAYFPELLELKEEEGGKKVFRRHRDKARYYEIQDRKELEDIDHLQGGSRMKEYLAKKTIGFYLTVIAAAAAVIGIINYSFASGAASSVLLLTAATVVVEILMIIGLAVLKNRTILNLFPAVCAILMSAAVAFSFGSQVDGLAFLISGLYSFNDMKNFLLFAGFGVIAAVLYIVSSFMDMEKKE